ncbi:acyl-CoA thioesterase domain-containing protein [Nocardia sp. CC201C]|uniref:acyl-CoA thioesterase domain-containing protein n=1 Tax=Nocardia sp. CC201C TaxID=3044575 RepID=UPI0024A9B00E|nr:acyl-CoA thioesterase domain-containing protein [Nocardia sp. CC201C]
MLAFFKHVGNEFIPLPFAASQWSRQTVNGTAVTGLATWALERDRGADDMHPHRLTVDLLRQPRFEPMMVRTLPIHAGKTVRIVDVEIEQGAVIVARASLVLTRTSANPPGTRWAPAQRAYDIPSDELLPPEGPGIVWGSDAHPGGWSAAMADHQNDSRKRLWVRQAAVVDGADPTPFVRAAMAAELANTLTSWGDTGIGFINHDITMCLARLPVGVEIGLEAENHLAVNGIAAGTATLFDRAGAIGTCVAGSIANAFTSVDATSKAGSWDESARERSKVTR